MFKKENHFPVSSGSEVVNSTVCHTICQSANNLHKSSLKIHSLNCLDFPTRAGTSSDTRKYTHCPCTNPFKHQANTGQECLEDVNLHHKKTVPLLWAEFRPYSLNPYTTPIWNNFFFFATVLSDKNNSSSSVTDLLDLLSSRAAEPTRENLCTASLSFTGPVVWVWPHRSVWFKICSTWGENKLPMNLFRKIKYNSEIFQISSIHFSSPSHSTLSSNVLIKFQARIRRLRSEYFNSSIHAHELTHQIPPSFLEVLIG